MIRACNWKNYYFEIATFLNFEQGNSIVENSNENKSKCQPEKKGISKYPFIYNPVYTYQVSDIPRLQHNMMYHDALRLWFFWNKGQ